MHCPAVTHALAEARTQDLLAEAAAQRAGRTRRMRPGRRLAALAIAVVAALGASAGVIQ